MESLAEERRRYHIPLPDILTRPLRGRPLKKAEGLEELKPLFPRTFSQPFVAFEEGEAQNIPLKVGVVFSGGQAAGGHNVIAGVFDALAPKSRLWGFLDGPAGIVEQRWVELNGEKIAPYRNQGGFDLLGSGRTKIETPEQFDSALKAVLSLELDGLVIIGGDDSNTNAALLAEYFLAHNCKTKVVGVPKTIDGDLRSADVEISFGFDTASKIYSELIGNILCDARSAKKYTFFIKVMGRSASHLALECALRTHPNLTLISEEVAAKGMTLREVAGQIADLIEARAKVGKNYGAVLIPEGLIEFIPEFSRLIKELNQLLLKGPFAAESLSPPSLACYNSIPEALQKQLLLDRDPHGNIKVSQIETERLLIEVVQGELKRRKSPAKFSPIPLFYGYEGRSGLPSNFDCHYSYALGRVAALLIQEGYTGYMACVKNLSAPLKEWQVLGVPLTSMLHLEERKGKSVPVIKKALVDLNGRPFLDFAARRVGWQQGDDYLVPGPIQFFGPKQISDSIPLTL